MELLLLLVPFITSIIMFAVKALAGLAMTDNDGKPKVFLRSVLVIFSLGGYIATQTLAGQDVDPNRVSELVEVFLSTGVLAYLSHAFYNSAFRR